MFPRFAKLTERERNKYFPADFPRKFEIDIFFIDNTIPFFSLSLGATAGISRPPIFWSHRALRCADFQEARACIESAVVESARVALSLAGETTERTRIDSARLGKFSYPPKVIAHTAVGRFAPTKIDGARAPITKMGPVISRAIPRSPLSSAFAAIFGNGPSYPLASIDRTIPPRQSFR